MFYVYVIRCHNNDLYIGYSDDLRQRIKNHVSGKVKSTKDKSSLILVYYEAYRDKRDATKREKELKQHRAKEFLKEHIKSSLENGPVVK